MRILHLSDLHLTGQFRSFEEVWSGPSPHLAPGSFDFVVISGDLSQRSAPAEYQALSAFLESSVLPLLVEKERTRLVLVPGNHDVDWSADIGEWLSLGHELDRDPGFAERIRKAQLEPEASDLRVSLSQHGHLNVLRLDPERYPSRFQNVQRFLDTFYTGAAPSEHFRPFALTHENDAEHWSAHVFPGSGIAFYGFNSCHRNDRYWTGAMLSAKAVQQARRHAEKHARNCIRIAVWHHGLASGRGRPDYLSVEDLGLLYHAGFRIGFHGHTHRAAYETFDALFGNRFFIVSTGSLGAGSEERPDAIGNQFSIAQVYPGHVDVETFTRDGNSTSYEKNRERRRFLLTEPSPPRLDQLSHAASHRRTWTVEASGVARLDVELRDITLRGEVTLALIEPPFCNVLAQETAETPTGHLNVERKDLPDGRIRFTLTVGHEEKLEWLRWSYHISNCLALNRADLNARGEPTPSLKSLPSGFDGRPHTVRFPCDEFSITLRLPKSTRLLERGVHAAALKRVEEQGLERWVADLAEVNRGRTQLEGSQVQFTLTSPLVDYRYLLAYAPAENGPGYTSDHIGLLKWLIEQCRNQSPTSNSLPVALTRALAEELSRALGADVGQESEWVGYLWHPERRMLLAAFGMFPNRGWSVRFAWGSGVAGHALRFSQETSWIRDNGSHQSLIYRPNPKESPEGDYSWIVCIPILASLEGPALGVVGFAGNGHGGPGEAQLREYAEHVARKSIDEGFRNRLFSVVHSAFWQVLRSWKGMTPRMRHQVQQSCEALELPPSPESGTAPSHAPGSELPPRSTRA